MTYAANGAAIIGSVVVPPTEVKILRELALLNRPATVAEIGVLLRPEMDPASIHSLMHRLWKKRQLVSKTELTIQVLDTSSFVKRIVWRALPVATEFFSREPFFTGNPNPGS